MSRLSPVFSLSRTPTNWSIINLLRSPSGITHRITPVTYMLHVCYIKYTFRIISNLVCKQDACAVFVYYFIKMYPMRCYNKAALANGYNGCIVCPNISQFPGIKTH